MAVVWEVDSHFIVISYYLYSCVIWTILFIHDHSLFFNDSDLNWIIIVLRDVKTLLSWICIFFINIMLFKIMHLIRLWKTDVRYRAGSGQNRCAKIVSKNFCYEFNAYVLRSPCGTWKHFPVGPYISYPVREYSDGSPYVSPLASPKLASLRPYPVCCLVGQPNSLFSFSCSTLPSVSLSLPIFLFFSEIF